MLLPGMVSLSDFRSIPFSDARPFPAGWVPRRSLHKLPYFSSAFFGLNHLSVYQKVPFRFYLRLILRYTSESGHPVLFILYIKVY